MSGLSYPIMLPYDLLGTPGNPVTLTSGFGDNLSPPQLTNKMAEVAYFFEYTSGDGGNDNKIEFLIEGSPDEPTDANQSFYQETFSSIVSGIIVLTPAVRDFPSGAASTLYTGFFFVPPVYKQVRISAREVLGVGGGNFGSVVLRTLICGN